MGEGVGGGAVQCQLCTDPDPRDHEPDLVDQAVGQDASKVVLNDRVEDGEHGHGGADVDEDFGACVATRQSVNGELGGESAKEDGAGRGRFRISIGQPVVQERERALDSEGEKDQPPTG